MRDNYYENSKDYINRWVVSYADLVTMLLALFLVMYAVNVTKYQAMAQEVQQNLKVEVIESVDEKLEKILEENVKENPDISVIKEPKGVVLRINNNIIFDNGSAEIKAEAKETLDEIINTLSKIDNPVIIEGHTDSVPIKTSKYPSNWELSTARATNMINYILKTGKIPPKRLSAVGYGEYMPIGDNTSISGRMLNRRVDIIILEK